MEPISNPVNYWFTLINSVICTNSHKFFCHGNSKNNQFNQIFD